MNETETLIALAALAEKTRLRILRYLVEQGPEGASAGDIALAVKASSPRASFHLSNLAQAGLVYSERHARSIVYRVDFARMGGLIGYLIRDCCGNHREVVACCATEGC